MHSFEKTICDFLQIKAAEKVLNIFLESTSNLLMQLLGQSKGTSVKCNNFKKLV